jgi:hypothetical protein
MVSQEWILPIQADSKERRFAIADLHAAQNAHFFSEVPHLRRQDGAARVGFSSAISNRRSWG